MCDVKNCKKNGVRARVNIFFFPLFVEGVSLDRIEMILNDVGRQRILFDIYRSIWLDGISLVSWLGNLSSYG